MSRQNPIVQRIKDRIAELDQMMNDCQAVIVRHAAEKRQLESLLAEPSVVQTPTLRRTRKSRKTAEPPTGGVTTIKGKWECHTDECPNNGKTFTEAKVLATGHKAHKPLCPHCLMPVEGEADLPNGAES